MSDFTSGAWQTDDPEYPRHLTQRRTWQNLNGEWRFHVDDGSAAHPRHVAEWEARIRVPFAPETPLSGIHDESFHADVWYEREFEVAPSGDDHIFLHFGAVDYHALVWVNGIFVGSHKGGHTPFSFDITHVLVDGSQTVTVWAHDDPQDLQNPRGKQDWQLESHSIWYPRTTGIWQTVWIEEVPAAHIARLRISTHLERWEIGCEAFVKGRGDFSLRVRVRHGDRVLADDTYALVSNEVHRRIALSDPGIDDYRNELLWSPETPVLIAVDVLLLDGDRVVDELRSYTALREVVVDRGPFLLNNRPYPLRLVLDQGYWPESFMTPPSEEAIIRDIELVKAAGFNGVRKHQKIEDPRFLYWADRLGLLVWEEMPSAYRFTTASVKRITREWIEVIDRDVSHPCIIVWVPFNESWGVPNLPANRAQRDAVQALYSLTRTLDPTRPVIGNDGWEATATDIIGIHDYDDDPERIRDRYARDGDELPVALRKGWPGGRAVMLEDYPHQGQPLMLTEFGGIEYSRPTDPAVAGSWGYSRSESADDLAGKYTALLEAVTDIPAFTGFCYTQFTDTFQETNGLFFADRTPKFELDAMRLATRSGHRYPHEVTSAELERP